MKLQDYTIDPEHPTTLSLAKIAGVAIESVEVHITTQFDEPMLTITGIVFKDGTRVEVDGEHEVAYIYSYLDSEEKVPSGLRESSLEKLQTLEDDYWNERYSR